MHSSSDAARFCLPARAANARRGSPRSWAATSPTVLDALHAFNTCGVTCLRKGSSTPHHPPPRAFAGERAEQLRALVHRSPRDFGHPTSLWTLDLVAEVSFAQGLTPHLVTGEAVRKTLVRLGIDWKRAKHWITSPDRGYERKKGSATV